MGARAAAFVLILVLVLSPGPVLAAQSPAPTPGQSSAPAPADSMVGAWGVFPAPADSVMLQPDAPGTPWWGHVVRAPFLIVLVPLGLVFDGAGLVVQAMDEAGWIAWLGRLIGPSPVDVGVQVGIEGNPLEGLGGGATLYHRKVFGAEGQHMRLRVAGSTQGTVKLTAGLRLGEGTNRGWDLGIGYRLRPRARYFGLGPRSFDHDLSYYKQQTGWVGATYLHGLTESLGGQVGLQWTRIHADAPYLQDADRSIGVVHGGDLPEGYGRSTDGFSVGLGLVHDDTRGNGRPLRGGVRVVKVNLFESLDTEELGYATARVDLQQFVGLWNDHQVLALRVFAAWLERLGDDAFPFQRLYVNDDPDQLRGYLDFRWRDRGITGLNVEYRWPVWAATTTTGIGLDAVLFGDFGQVFGDGHELSLENYRASGGFGFRFGTGESLAGRFDVAFSREETVVWFTANQLFQFERDHYLHGRNPVPLR